MFFGAAVDLNNITFQPVIFLVPKYDLRVRRLHICFRARLILLGVYSSVPGHDGLAAEAQRWADFNKLLKK